jgi:hypothetical protein
MCHSCRRFAAATWLVLAALAVHSCSALDQPRSFLRQHGETSVSTVQIQDGLSQLVDAAVFQTEGPEEAIAAKMVPQIIESVGAAMTSIVSSPDGSVVASTWSKDTDRRELLRGAVVARNEHRQLQGTLVEEILAEIIVIVITAVAEVLVAVIAGVLATTLSDPIAGLAEEIIGGIIVALAGFIAAAIVDALFGGGTQLRAFVTNTFGQQSTAVAKPKFLQWFSLRKKISAPEWLSNTMNRLNTTKLTKNIASKLKLPTGKSVVGGSFSQVFRTTMDNFDMAGLQQEIASTLPMSSINLTMDTSAVNATALGETMLAMLDIMAKK